MQKCIEKSANIELSNLNFKKKTNKTKTLWKENNIKVLTQALHRQMVLCYNYVMQNRMYFVSAFCDGDAKN